MNQVVANKIFTAIKSDNLVDFSSLIKGRENFCFGRFPVLTVCLLFKAKKIIKKFRDKLLNQIKYTIVPENFEIYKIFRSVAGRALRLYTSEDCIVSPTEILAILGNDKKVKKYFKLSTNKKKIVDNLMKIYSFSSQKVMVKDNKLKISWKPLTGYQKRNFKIGFIASLSCIFVFSCLLTIFTFTTGLGTTWAPFYVYSQAQLYQALKTDGNYVLANDVTIDSLLLDSNFEGTLNGNNKTIYISNVEGSLLNTNNGTIKNLNIVYSSIEKEISNSLSLLVSNNQGTIENVNITCELLNLSCVTAKNSNVNVSCFSNTNTGTIKNCSLFVKSTVSATGNGECFLTGFANENSGKVENCVLKDGSYFSSVEADIAGFVNDNKYSGLVANCKNYALISQTSNRDGWSPNASGIVQTNYGKVENCFNLAKITVISTNDFVQAQGNVLVGGIACVNYGEIVKCLNKADLQATVKNIWVYCGGIAAQTNYWSNEGALISSTINNCGSIGNISAESEGENAYLFVGGVSGFVCYASLIDNFSNSVFVGDFDNTKSFVGTFAGSFAVDYSSGTFLLREIKNNYILKSNVISKIIGVGIECIAYTNGKIDLIGTIPQQIIVNENAIKNVETEEEFKQLEVYWNE